ncbi:MAG: exodeoxyribonuclease VII large subunit [Ignavibacteriaceae bacterium]|nr:exodeoxyribonuclease VII large subunit [Ignavibacteriaceae bacterium]
MHDAQHSIEILGNFLLQENILTVSHLTGKIKKSLESGFDKISVKGEISNFKNQQGSGHWYFVLKDSEASLNCAMWGSNNKRVRFLIKDGIQVILKGRITVYPPRGTYQLDTLEILPDGIGALYQAYQAMLEKLRFEGLFDAKYKKPLPSFPLKVGIVTALDGAAIRDMIAVAKRRMPLLELVLVNTKVQGEGAAESIASGIELLNKQNDVDVIIAGRGGGSIEDLWAFNEEITARAIFNSKIPVISAVGHESDTTIADFVADLRAATPTAAMELLTSNTYIDYKNFIENFLDSTSDEIDSILRRYKKLVESYSKASGAKIPLGILKINSQRVDYLIEKIDNLMISKIEFIKNRVNLLYSNIKASDSKKILKRGFVYLTQEEKIVKNYGQLNSKKDLTINFFDKKIKILKNYETKDT